MQKATKQKIIIFVVILILIAIILPFVISLATYDYHFNKRITHENNYFDYLSELNPDFSKEEVSFASNEGQILEGAFYSQASNQSPQALVVWVHGMGVSHENYLAEIEMLTKENYLVFSYDNTGVDDSEGESLKGLSQSPIDLSFALSYLNETEKFADLPLILIGHSWGGFAVSAVSQLNPDMEIDGIVTLAGFWRNINVIEDIAKPYVGNAIKILAPYFTLFEKINFGEFSQLDGITGLSNSDAKVLIIHSKDDNVVTFDGNYEVYYEAFSDDERFEFIEYEDAGHKLTINANSYLRIHDIMHHQMEHDENSEEFLTMNEERLSLITDFNMDVMNNIIEFCDEIATSIPNHTRS